MRPMFQSSVENPLASDIMSIYGKLSLLGVSIVSRACKQQVDSLSDAVAYAYIVNDNDLLGEEGYKMLTVSVSV